MTDQSHEHPASRQPCANNAPLHTRYMRTGRGRASDERDALRALEQAEIRDAQLVPWGSNFTFAVALEIGEPEPFVGIYKPEQGEAPLWDFQPGTLFQREYASYLLSRFLGWRFVPPTVIRSGPHGVGTVQLYIEPEQDRGRATNLADFRDELMRIALFDVIANNADRKASHFYLGKFQRQLWGIDHGLTFNCDPKLRTVIWDFEGEPIPPHLRKRLARLDRHQELLFRLLDPYLKGDEILMVLVRAEQILRTGTMPMLRSRRNIPYGW